MFRRYSSCAPGRAGPPPTTETCAEIETCWPEPTTTTVGCGGVAGLPLLSVSRFGSPALLTTAWLLIAVPAGVPGLTRKSYLRTAVVPGEIVPTLMPEASGAAPPSGWPTGDPLRSV